MGINEINGFLKKMAPRTFRRVNTDLFKGSRIAVDAPLWAYASFSAAYAGYVAKDMKTEDMLSVNPISKEARERVRHSVCEHAMYFVCDLYSRGITPIFVFDGTSVPEKTSGARKRREATRNKIAERIASLRSSLNEVEPLCRSRNDLNALRALLRQAPPVNKEEDLPFVRAFIIKCLGAPTITAPDEAEKFCARLASRGIVAASWTTDTDSFACGAPIFITGMCTGGGGKTSGTKESAADADVILVETGEDMNGGEPVPAWQKPFKPPQSASSSSSSSGARYLTHFSATFPPMAQLALGLSLAQFVDLCIMFECDFNSRMPGIGPAKAWSLLKDARAASPSSARLIEVASTLRPELPWEVLNAERCREIFMNMTACDELIDSLPVDAFDASPERATNARASSVIHIAAYAASAAQHEMAKKRRKTEATDAVTDDGRNEVCVVSSVEKTNIRLLTDTVVLVK